VSGDSILEVRGLTVAYGGLRAVDDMDLHVEQGQIVGLIGPNGAGKTSCIDAMTGLARYSGTVALAGRSLDGLGPHHRARIGLRRTFQAVELFDDLTVMENLQVAAESSLARRSPIDTLRRRRNSTASAVDTAIEMFDLGPVVSCLPSKLSYGQRRLVGMARTVAGSPQVILLDEPAAGLSQEETASLGMRLRRIAESGPSCLLVDHDMGLVLTTCTYVYVLEFGRVIARGTPQQIRQDRSVATAYLGTLADSGIGNPNDVGGDL
jgi:branched-chain amino acid transport system ATP-binding protein